MATKTTSQKLAEVLQEAGLHEMSKKAATGYYDDFSSPIATPKLTLIRELAAVGKKDLVRRVMEGEWDATKEEADAWYAREGHRLLHGKRF